jgi:hypothetical protein
MSPSRNLGCVTRYRRFESGFLQRGRPGLIPIGEVKVAALDGENADPANGRYALATIGGENTWWGSEMGPLPGKVVETVPG